MFESPKDAISKAPQSVFLRCGQGVNLYQYSPGRHIYSSSIEIRLRGSVWTASLSIKTCSTNGLLVCIFRKERGSCETIKNDLRSPGDGKRDDRDDAPSRG